ncbi:cytoadherence linked asexual protein, putative [Plasmodium knowlesi strain H]|uniref:Cytoadherence linked asexual protein, putative n=3 Tax=Plasmodium knowlesi TaxID=5850 RepID=A0A679L713_PLAKH|nr:cytoadherence linked asexual protein, putative [Plasmodium knowlesi strain H]OTN63698.1 putative Cytoadherence linked asexual protein [Plasmodium knowlesi]CAA9990612.1 cytoadherence linked asexual protein, putative [Plasmodium knowlesi strain H]SBO26057.1 cytoadherence linked asexual protein, putative [Plasmodium knowlesi strain H]VVS80086.1 cytoadherence linked asexual protein, putative [Plasmodium knowlesi strain H]
MTSLRNIQVLFLFLLLFISKNVIGYVSVKENLEELKYVVEGKEMFDNLKGLERIIIQSLKYDKVLVPVLNPNVEEYLNMSNFMILKHNINGENQIKVVIPGPNADIHDLIKYEHVTKQQIIQTYDSENSDSVKKKLLLLKALKITKLMLIPMHAYEKTKDLKKALEELNAVFFPKDEEVCKENSYQYSKSYFEKIINYINRVKRKESKDNAYSTIIIGEDLQKIQESNDLFFTTNDNIEFMSKLDKIANHFGIAMYNLVGSNLIALGHFLVLQLALRRYDQFFKFGKMRFFNWQKILSFSATDRFKVLDTMCNVQGFHDVLAKRRVNYLKDDRTSTFDECNILEFLVHYFNKYQNSLVSGLYQEDFKVHYLQEHTDIKNEFFKFMCNDINHCNIYNSKLFLSENDPMRPLNSDSPYYKSISAYNLYTNFFYFTRHYNEFTLNHILYVHFLNLTGILNNENKAFVTALYLPGYYNAIELSYDQESLLTDLIGNLLKCVEKCNSIEDPPKESVYYDSSMEDYGQSKSTKCNLCKGVFTYINSKHEESSSMLQKFFTFVTKIMNINSVSTLVRNLGVYEEYDNFLTNDINWYTFLLLLRLTSYKKIAEKDVADAMYLDLRKEDKFNKTVTTNYWYPSYLKKAYTLYVRNRMAINLVEKLENLLSKGTIEKIKKSVRFLLHVNSFLQLDFFHNLNEPRPGEYRMNPLSMELESQFAEWSSNSNLGYFFLNYDNPDTRKEMHEKLRSDRMVIPKFHKVSVMLRKHISKAYVSYFNQRHVRNLYEKFDSFNVSNKIVLMRDSYESYLENYKDIIFLADIFNMRKYLTATPRAKKISDRIYYFIHNILGNSVNFYKYGMIYGFVINKEYFKEVANELYTIFKLNQHIFTDISFLQTVYLLSRKIENSFNVQRRNDKISINNLFFLNVSSNYSKMSKEERLEELNNSMASRFFSKTFFSTFQTMFVSLISNKADKLDKQYGSANMLGLTLSEKAFMKYALIYHGSIMDNITNSLVPTYAKKPIEQLKYGKTFILSNYFMLSSQVYSLLNLNNLSQLCEYQAISSSSYYSQKKLGRFIDKKMLPIVVYYLILRVHGVRAVPNDFVDWYNIILRFNQFHPSICVTVHMMTNLYFDTPHVFPSSLGDKLGEQTEHMAALKPSSKPFVFGFTKMLWLELLNGMSCIFALYPFVRYYAFQQNFVYFFVNPFRFMDRFNTPVDSYIKNMVRIHFRKYTTDEIIKFAEKTILNIKRQGKIEEAMESRLEAKRINEHPIIQRLNQDFPMIAPQEYERLQKMDSVLYGDDNLVFDSLDKEEKFLNDKYIISDVPEEDEGESPPGSKQSSPIENEGKNNNEENMNGQNNNEETNNEENKNEENKNEETNNEETNNEETKYEETKYEETNNEETNNEEINNEETKYEETNNEVGEKSTSSPEATFVENNKKEMSVGGYENEPNELNVTVGEQELNEDEDMLDDKLMIKRKIIGEE